MTHTILGKWKKTGSTLGQGGQGAVYEVVKIDNPDGPRYAMKIIGKSRPPKAVERFHREIEALKKLNHPNILRVIDHSDISSEEHFLVVELLEKADTLRTLLQDRKSPCFANPLKGLDFFSVLLDVIGECAKHGIVHRDLSPANVLFLPDGNIKVIDFGLCQFEDAQRMTLIDEGVGTPNYMAPETESGSDQEITFKADLYSAGKLLWSAVTNQFAFARESPVFTSKSLANVFSDQPTTWHLHHIFEKTIRKRAGDRFPSVEKAVEETNTTRSLILGRYPPLELFKSRCPICGFGTLSKFDQSHAVFGNPNPQGIIALQCTHCHVCFAIDMAKLNAELERRKKLE
jgi:serine/threonine protein kinase